MTAAGELNRRIKLWHRLPGENARGEQLKQWVLVIEVSAKVMPLRGREFFAAGAEQSEITTKFRIRWRAGVTEKMRVTWRDQPFDIASPPIEVDGGREWLDLMCKAGVGDGRVIT